MWSHHQTGHPEEDLMKYGCHQYHRHLYLLMMIRFLFLASEEVHFFVARWNWSTESHF
jgi:hypothetical protein